MIDNEIRMTSLERYVAYKRVLERPTFNSIEDAEKNMRAKEGERRQFVVREPLGIYRVHYAFMTQPRGADELQWACNEEYYFSHGDLTTACNQAAHAVGFDLVRSM